MSTIHQHQTDDQLRGFGEGEYSPDELTASLNSTRKHLSRGTSFADMPESNQQALVGTIKRIIVSLSPSSGKAEFYEAIEQMLSSLREESEQSGSTSTLRSSPRAGDLDTTLSKIPRLSFTQTHKFVPDFHHLPPDVVVSHILPFLAVSVLVDKTSSSPAQKSPPRRIVISHSRRRAKDEESTYQLLSNSPSSARPLFGYFCRDVLRHPWFVFTTFFLGGGRNIPTDSVIFPSKRIRILIVDGIRSLSLAPPLEMLVCLNELQIAVTCQEDLGMTEILEPILSQLSENSYPKLRIKRSRVKSNSYSFYSRRPAVTISNENASIQSEPSLNWKGHSLTLKSIHSAPGLVPDDCSHLRSLRCSPFVLSDRLIQIPNLKHLDARTQSGDEDSAIVRLYPLRVLYQEDLSNLTSLSVSSTKAIPLSVTSGFLHLTKLDLGVLDSVELFRTYSLPCVKELKFTWNETSEYDPTRDWRFHASQLRVLKIVCVKSGREYDRRWMVDDSSRIVNRFLRKGKSLVDLDLEIGTLQSCHGWRIPRLKKFRLIVHHIDDCGPKFYNGPSEISDMDSDTAYDSWVYDLRKFIPRNLFTVVPSSLQTLVFDCSIPHPERCSDSSLALSTLIYRLKGSRSLESLRIGIASGDFEECMEGEPFDQSLKNRSFPSLRTLRCENIRLTPKITSSAFPQLEDVTLLRVFGDALEQTNSLNDEFYERCIATLIRRIARNQAVQLLFSLSHLLLKSDSMSLVPDRFCFFGDESEDYDKGHIHLDSAKGLVRLIGMSEMDLECGVDEIDEERALKQLRLRKPVIARLVEMVKIENGLKRFVDEFLPL